MSAFLPPPLRSIEFRCLQKAKNFGNKSIETYYLWIEPFVAYDFLVKIRFSPTDADCQPDNASGCAARRGERVDGPLIARKFVKMHIQSLCECDKCRNFRYFNCSPPHSAEREPRTTNRAIALSARPRLRSEHSASPDNMIDIPESVSTAQSERRARASCSVH